MQERFHMDVVLKLLILILYICRKPFLIQIGLRGTLNRIPKSPFNIHA